MLVVEPFVVSLLSGTEEAGRYLKQSPLKVIFNIERGNRKCQKELANRWHVRDHLLLHQSSVRTS
nr:MAG TPA: hypothetical protein [Caudoviricetes sp.]